jgi:hypothetical protein
MIRHALIQRDPHERPNRQTIAGAPCDSALRIDPFEIAHHQQSEIDPQRQARPSHFASVEILTDRFDVLIELLLIQDLIHPRGKTDGSPLSAAPPSVSTTPLAAPASFVVPSP